MLIRYLTVLLLGVIAGCARPAFTNLGNGVGVPVESIENYAREHGVSRAEAPAQLRSELDECCIKDDTRNGVIREETEMPASVSGNDLES